MLLVRIRRKDSEVEFAHNLMAIIYKLMYLFDYKIHTYVYIKYFLFTYIKIILFNGKFIPFHSNANAVENVF